MALTYQYPGVYIEEKPSGSRPIQGVGTAVAAFLGFTERRPAGNVGQPRFVASWTQYENEFGGFVPGFLLPLAVYGYFLNGGAACYIQSLATKSDNDRAAEGKPARVMLFSQVESNALELKTKPGAPAGVEVAIDDATGEGVTDEQFKVTIKIAGRDDEVYDNLTMDKRNANHAVKVLSRSEVITALDMESPGSLVEKRPRNGRYTLEAAATGALISAEEIKGNASERTGMGALEEVADVTMLVCPELMGGVMTGKLKHDDVIAIQQAMLDHCALMKDRFAILDAPPGFSPQEVHDWRMKEAMFNSKYGALYYPWITIANPTPRNENDRWITIPPSGHIAGVYARVDQERGVHKAPANEQIRGAVKLEKQVINSEQAKLNPDGINCIRAFPGRGIMIWGARTLAEPSSEWRYINVRRLFNFVEESIYEGTQWVVFEPNDTDLWERVKRTITAFLTRIWREGALFGATPQEAFFVKCDADLNPPEVRDEGMLIVEIGLAPVKPAEFVIFRFSQKSDGGSLSE
jgi:hypothetical protein